MSTSHFDCFSVVSYAFPSRFVYAAYNAIWDPEDSSVTRFLQCKSCLSQRPVVPAALIGAEIQYPRDMTRDQVTFMDVCMLSVHFMRLTDTDLHPGCL